jgi:hypothetical protein
MASPISVEDTSSFPQAEKKIKSAKESKSDMVDLYAR